MRQDLAQWQLDRAVSAVEANCLARREFAFHEMDVGGGDLRWRRDPSHWQADGDVRKEAGLGFSNDLPHWSVDPSR